MGHSCTFEGSMKVGPWGGDSGTGWSFEAWKGGITEILVSHGEVIHSLIFKTDVGNGDVEYSKKFGGDFGADGRSTEKISLDWPREYLTTISGTSKTFEGWHVIGSLCFHTNISKYGPYGKKGGNGFSFPIEGGVVVGFHGRSGSYLVSIGIYVKKSISICSCNELVSTLKVDHMAGDVPRFPGPWGGSKGKPFDDGVFDGIEQVNVHCRNGIVHAIRLLYRSRNGVSVWSKRHGGDGDKIHRIKLPDNPIEYLVGIIGFYGPVEANNGSEALRSISLYTNKGKYGPFGDEIGTAFCSTVADGMVVGFHGRSGAYLDALGVHMLYF